MRAGCWLYPYPLFKNGFGIKKTALQKREYLVKERITY